LLQTVREAETRLTGLGRRLDEKDAEAVSKTAEVLRELLAELADQAASNDIELETSAEAATPRIGTVRAAILDRYLERNQALRFAVDDLEHAATLLAYLAELGASRRARKLPEFCRSWERKLRRHVTAVRKVAVATGADPDAAVELLDPAAIEPLEGELAAATAEPRSANGPGAETTTGRGSWFDRRFGRRRDSL
jgi:hypothetical protein